MDFYNISKHSIEILKIHVCTVFFLKVTVAGWGLFEDGGTQAKKVKKTTFDISLISNPFSAEQGGSGAAVHAVLQE